MPRVEEGHCDPLDCWGDSGFVSTNPSFPNLPGTPFSAAVIGCTPEFGIPVNDVPIKTLLNGTSVSPWVWLMFDGSQVGPSVTCSKTDWTDTIITTGNISQPPNGCSAVIKSFQFSWGTQQAGNVCKVQILDEKGSDFENWVHRLIRNPASGSRPDCRGVYKMRVRWGWMIAGGEGTECPTAIPSVTPLPMCLPGSSHTDGTPWSNNPKQIICSPDLWFIPNEINCSYQNNKFIFEITGIDPLLRAGERIMDKTYPEAQTNVDSGQQKKIHFTDAVRWLSYDATPRFNVSFLSLPELPTGSDVKPQKMRFFLPENYANIRHWHLDTGSPYPITGGGFGCNLNIKPISVTDAVAYRNELEEFGPLNVWKCDNLPPIGIINSWLSTGAVMAKSAVAGPDGRPGTQGIGITLNYDSTWDAKNNTEYWNGNTPVNADPKYLDCGWPAKGRLILWSNAYPTCQANNIFWYDRLKACYIVNGGKCSAVLGFNPSIKWNWNIAMTQGGTISPNTGRPTSANSLPQDLGCRVPPGFGPRNASVPNTVLAGNGPDANRQALIAHTQHARANMFANGIEAELRVQGDPSDWLCSSVLGTMRTVAIVVVNPFFLDREDTEDCPVWRQLSSATQKRCNNILTNRNWFIRGVEHQIKEGSYITTLKLVLFPPMGEAQAGTATVATVMGLDPMNQLTQTFVCQQGTLSCKDRLEDPSDVEQGTQELCLQPCGGDFQVT